MLHSAETDYAADPVGYCRNFRSYYKCPYTDLDGVYHPPPPAPGGGTKIPPGGRTGAAVTDDYYIKLRLNELEYLIAGATSSSNLFPNKRYIHSLLAEKKKLLKQLAAYNKKHGLSGGALAGLDDLADMADGPALTDSLVKGTVDVVNAIKPQPKPAPAPGPYTVGGMDWTTLALYAGAVVGGVYLFKKLGKKR